MLGLKDIHLKKNMDNKMVNKLIGDFITFADNIYKGNSYPHNWICICGNSINSRTWKNIRMHSQLSCGHCRHEKSRNYHKEEVNKIDGYKYINSYFKGDILPDGSINNDSAKLEIEHLYCNTINIVRATGFINDKKRCSSCCGEYENSFAYYIREVLKEPLDKYWDYDRNIENPYLISKGSNKPIYIYCQKHKYHGSYKTTPHQILAGKRCSYCKGTLVHYLDSFGYKFPHFVEIFTDGTDPFSILPNSNKRCNTKCPNCGMPATKPRIIQKIAMKGYSCKHCGDGISIPEKFLNNLLKQLRIHFYPQHRFSWALGKRYDIYIPSLNIIIEIHGPQHYDDKSSFIKGSLNDVIENDFNKFEAAIKSKSFSLYDYYVVDAQISSFEYLKNSCILALGDIINLTNVDWDKVWIECQNSLVKISWDLWNTGDYSVIDIACRLQSSRSTIIKYLKIGTELGFCNYDPKLENKKSGYKNGKATSRTVVYKSNFGQIKEFTTDEICKFLNINYVTLIKIIKTNNGIIEPTIFKRESLKLKLSPHFGAILQYKH